MTYAVSVDTMIVGTMGTTDCRVKTRFGTCHDLNKLCHRAAQKIGVECVVCNRIQDAMKFSCEFRPLGLAKLKTGEMRYLYSFDQLIDQQEDVEFV